MRQKERGSGEDLAVHRGCSSGSLEGTAGGGNEAQVCIHTLS